MTEGSSVNASKRCRDYVYLLFDVKKMIKYSKEAQIYTFIEQTIDSFNTTVQSYVMKSVLCFNLMNILI